MASSGESGGGFGARRRRWSFEDKARIVAECEAAGASVSMVARRHDLNANMLFTWRRQFRQPCGTGEGSFVPAVISPEENAYDRPTAMPGAPQPGLVGSSAPRPTVRIEIVLADSWRIIVDQDVTAAALTRVIDVLKRR